MALRLRPGAKTVATINGWAIEVAHGAVATPCAVGSVVDYKRNGARGSLLCRVLAFKGARMKLRPIVTSSGQPIEEPRAFWTGNRVLRVLDERAAAGLRIGPAP